MQLKRWESPRREGRNDKGRGGSARKRQLKKQRQMVRQRLKEANSPENTQNKGKGKTKTSSPFFMLSPENNLVVIQSALVLSQYGSDKHFKLIIGFGEKVTGLGLKIFLPLFPFPFPL
ncbi:hypothetical protein I8748_12695 [Nostoc sp. CENA67]|uniref:Uncharacterized protein n=1 Tax=Amazonocrinis nigriterrae CENA67 TaxID=2794033 RepID=A0A8J7HTH7_9NOST|nr:hypothetical protein [Amazonocrinis nigriterrae]MBH8563030.1 hypothetical protein [Amazonocrinis nigriterrae CENA67]